MKKSLLICFLLIASALVKANVHFVAAPTGAACYEVCYYNNYLYAGCGHTLMAFDVSSGKPGSKTFEKRLGSDIDNIQEHNGFLYVSANHAGISKWDVSNPAAPQFVTEYIPANLDEAAYDVAFKGDTIFAAYKTKVAVFKDNGSSLQFLTSFFTQTGNTRIRGVAVKNNLLAFTVAYSTSNITDGIYIYNANTLAQISYTKQTYCDPEDVVFGQQNNLLHVLGGTNTVTNPFDMSGLYYALDITNPNTPLEKFRDTIPGFIILGSISQPMNAEIINDTLYVATQGGITPNSNPFTCSVYVYDATNPSAIKLITDIVGGLYHFDIAIHNNRMYVASEWYGIKTFDIANIFNEVDLGNRLTGGWNISSDKYGSKLVQANEGVGPRLYDISNIQSPVMIGQDTAIGFCMSTDFSSDGKYIYGYYLTEKQFRVFDVNNMQMVGYLNNDVGEKRTCVYQNKAISASGTKISFIDVTTPASPVIQSQLTINAYDVFVTGAGKMFVSTNDSLVVYDITGSTAQWKSSVKAGIFQDFRALAFFQDTVYVYLTGKGLTRFSFNSSTNALTQTGQVTISNGEPGFMAADDWGLYLAYTKYGLDTYSKTSLTFQSNYRTGLEFVHDFLWGVQDLYCKDGYIFLSEYFGQTSILTNDPQNTVGVINISYPEQPVLKLYPNPAGDEFKIDMVNQRAEDIVRIDMLTMNENVISSIPVTADFNFTVSIKNKSAGVYVVRMITKDGKIFSGKIIVSE